MRRLSFLLIIGLFLSIPSFAQEVIYPKAEVFGGFSISSASISSSSTDPTTGLTTTTSLRETFMGWQASAGGNLTHRLSIVGDFGGQYKTVAGVPLNNYQFMFGPQISFRQPRVTPFVHALFGFDKFGTGSFTTTILGTTTTIPGTSSTGFGMGMGGGLDVNISDRLALRVPQFDWTPMHVGGVWTKNVIRIGFGLVIKAGQK